VNSQAFLVETAASLRRMTVKLGRLNGSMVEHDIAARRPEADIGLAFAMKVEQIEASLTALDHNISING
jgi:hypothetical protein